MASATKQLQNAGIATARLDCLVLLEDELGKDRAWLLAHPECLISVSSFGHLHSEISQRATHMPLAYIRGSVEFYGREFAVDTNTLVPRPETEALVDVLKSLQLTRRTKLLDIGTGSGCIAITAALELSATDVSACDIDNRCLKVAERNALTLGAHVTFFESDLLKSVESAYDVLFANLPYVPNNYEINAAAMHEPSLALFGGADGLDLYRSLFDEIRQTLSKPTFVLTESLPSQHEKLTLIAKTASYNQIAVNDFIQLFERD